MPFLGSVAVFSAERLRMQVRGGPSHLKEVLKKKGYRVIGEEGMRAGFAPDP